LCSCHLSVHGGAASLGRQQQQQQQQQQGAASVHATEQKGCQDHMLLAPRPSTTKQ
jgi:hypothetical protein